MGEGSLFRPGAPWHDTEGRPIQAHGGGLLHDRGTYYWFGEDKDGPTGDGPLRRVDVIGVACYSSTDLHRWTNRGLALPAVRDDPGHDLHPSKVAERPKVIYNARTRTYVMWLHVDRPDYAYARAGVAVSPTPAGPYRYLGSVRPCETDSRDLTLFQDADGSAYLVFSSEWNRNVTVAQLSDDYLRVGDAFVKALVYPRRNEGRESPAVFRHDDTYFMLTSGCTGWAPNRAEYAVAPSMLGPWEARGDPCAGPDAETTFRAQGTHVCPVAGRPGAFLFLADRWDSDDLRNSRYVWLPLRVRGRSVTIPWMERWDLSAFD